MPGVTLMHTATFEDLDPGTAYLLWQLRERVFVVEQECAYLDLDGRDLEADTLHVWADQDGAPVAYLRVLDDPGSGGAPTTARIGRVVVAPEQRGQGLARQLMRAALEQVGDRPCRLDAQAYLVDWYRGLGFEQVGEEFLEDGIPHVPMARQATHGR